MATRVKVEMFKRVCSGSFKDDGGGERFHFLPNSFDDNNEN
jgi:hypothetical protein